MRKHLLKKAMTLACAVAALTVNAQGISHNESLKSFENIPFPKVVMKNQSNMLLKKVADLDKKVTTRASDVKYTTPAGIIALAQGLQGYVNFLSFNMVENERSDESFNYLIAPVDSIVGYYNESTATGAFNWTIPGGDPATSTADDGVIVTYPTAGKYAFPTLTSGSSNYTAPGKIVVGGKGEIALANCLAAGETFDPLMLSYEGGGMPTGSNSSGLEAFGNLFVVFDDAMISTVNVYINANPKAKDAQNKVKMSICTPDLSTEALLDAKVLGTAELTISEMMADARDVTGLSAQGGGAFMGMASFKLATPVKVNSQEPFFISISNIGNDTAKGDSFGIMLDALTPSFEEPDNLFSWTSFIKAEGTDKKIHWFRMYKELFEPNPSAAEFFPNGNATLLICPVVDYAAAGNNISNVSSEVANKAFVANGVLSISSEGSKEAVVYTVSGQQMQSVSLNDGTNTVPTTGWAKGVYVVKFANGQNVKVVI